MFHEHDVIKLKHAVPVHSPTAWQGVPSEDLASGEKGTIVMVYTNGSTCEYEVEFVAGDGRTRALLRLKEEEIERM